MLTVSMDDYLQQMYPELDPGILAAVSKVYAAVLLVMLTFSVVTYVLHAVGTYSIARRRRIRRPWLSWLPVGRTWILGSISDRYQFVRNGRFRNRKKTLVCMELAMYVLEMALLFFSGSVLANMQTTHVTVKVPHVLQSWGKIYTWYTDRTVAIAPREDDILMSLQLVMILCVLIILAALIFTIFLYMAYYDLFASCRPDLKVVFLVLGILLPVTLPFFVFACRKHDLGMENTENAATENAAAVDGQVFLRDT